MQPTAILDQKIDALRPRFLEMLSARLERFQQIRDRLAGFHSPEDPVGNYSGAADPADPLAGVSLAGASLPALLDDLCFGAHRIAGVAATFGFSTLGSLARAVEQLLRPFPPQGPRAAELSAELSAELLAALDDLLAEMTRVLR